MPVVSGVTWVGGGAYLGGDLRPERLPGRPSPAAADGAGLSRGRGKRPWLGDEGRFAKVSAGGVGVDGFEAAL